MSDAFFGRLVPSEDLVIKTTNLAISLKKVSADDVKGLGMEEGLSKFKLPGSLGNMGGGDINAKVETIFAKYYFTILRHKQLKDFITFFRIPSFLAKKAFR